MRCGISGMFQVRSRDKMAQTFLRYLQIFPNKIAASARSTTQVAYFLHVMVSNRSVSYQPWLVENWYMLAQHLLLSQGLRVLDEGTEAVRGHTSR